MTVITQEWRSTIRAAAVEDRNARVMGKPVTWLWLGLSESRRLEAEARCVASSIVVGRPCTVFYGLWQGLWEDAGTWYVTRSVNGKRQFREVYPTPELLDLFGAREVKP